MILPSRTATLDRQKRYSDIHDAFAINTQPPAHGQRHHRGRGRHSRAAARTVSSPGTSARGVEVVDGDTVVLEDGRRVRLVGIQAPKLPLGRPGFERWPLADEAKHALESLVLGENRHPCLWRPAG